MASLSDVAKAAGVSVTTASFVLNGHAMDKRISPQTAQRVLNAVRELGYVPNVAARKLTSPADRSTVIPDIAVMWSPALHNSFMASFITNAQQLFEQKVVPEMRITIAPYALGHIRNTRDSLLNRHFNGAVFSPSYQEDLAFINDFALRIPLIVLHMQTELHSSVVVDNYCTGKTAADVFAAKGHTAAAILYYSHVGTTSVRDLRYDGFRDACQSHGLRFEGVEIPLNKRGNIAERAGFGRQQALTYLEAGTLPEAVFIQDDAVASGFAVALLTAGVRVPRDIEIITYGNDDLACAFHPAITTMDYPAAAITQETLKLLSQQISDPYASPRHISVLPEVTFRDSCPRPENWKS